MLQRLSSLLLLFTLTAGAVAQDNIDVSTIPPREGVQLTIYNAEDLTLVRETRTLTFAAGDNPLQFSWHGTLIDPTSVELRFLTNGRGLDVIDTTYPHGRPQVLVWNVRAERETSATVEITYFTSGISWAADYVLTAAPNEATMRFDGFVRVTNNSGENYDNASIRLVVGEINLVERIADLARRGVISQEEAEEMIRRSKNADRGNLPRRALAAPMSAPMGGARSAPEIVKEGLSEYFIFTVEGTQDVPHQWSQRLRLFRGTDIPAKVVYRYRPREYGNQLVRLYTFRNDDASDLGESPLPNGIVRVFRRQGDDDGAGDGLAFLTAFTTKYIPIGQTVDVNLGPDREVVYTQTADRTWRDEFWYRQRNGNQLLGPGEIQRVTDNDTVVGWNEHARLRDRIRNGRGKPIIVELHRSFGGDTTLGVAGAEPNVDVTRFDVTTAQLAFTVPAASVRDLTLTVVTRMGENARQQRLIIEGIK